jgi:hypothetical protein
MMWRSILGVFVFTVIIPTISVSFVFLYIVVVVTIVIVIVVVIVVFVVVVFVFVTRAEFMRPGVREKRAVVTTAWVVIDIVPELRSMMGRVFELTTLFLVPLWLIGGIGAVGDPFVE